MITAKPTSVDADGTITLAGCSRGCDKLEKPKFSLPLHSMITEKAGDKGASCLAFLLLAVINLFTLFIPLIADLIAGARDHADDSKIYRTKLKQLKTIERKAKENEKAKKAHNQMVKAEELRARVAAKKIQKLVKPILQKGLLSRVRAASTLQKHFRAKALAKSDQIKDAKGEDTPFDIAESAILDANKLRIEKEGAHRGLGNLTEARIAHYKAYAKAQRLRGAISKSDRKALKRLKGMDPKFKPHYHKIMSS